MNYHNIRQIHSSSDPNCSPMLSYIPVVNYPYQERVFPMINQERVYPMINHYTERFAALAPFKSPPSTPEFKVDKTQD